MKTAQDRTKYLREIMQEVADLLATAPQTSPEVRLARGRALQALRATYPGIHPAELRETKGE